MMVSKLPTLFESVAGIDKFATAMELVPYCKIRQRRPYDGNLQDDILDELNPGTLMAGRKFIDNNIKMGPPLW